LKKLNPIQRRKEKNRKINKWEEGTPLLGPLRGNTFSCPVPPSFLAKWGRLRKEGTTHKGTKLVQTGLGIKMGEKVKKGKGEKVKALVRLNFGKEQNGNNL